MPASAVPLPAPIADPLAGLDSYYLQFLPAHLAEAGRSTDLFRLLLLQRGDNSNAWHTAKPDVAAYLADVGHGRALAVAQADCAKGISLGLIANSVRSITQLHGPTIEALVSRGLLSLPQAISMCAAAEPEGHVSGLARLLPRMGQPERGRHLQEILATMAVPVADRTTIGQASRLSRLPLRTEIHVEVIARLAALPGLAETELAAIERAAWLVGANFAGIESAVSVAEVLAREQRAQLLTRAWSVASGLDLFRGRPEATALVAACAARGGDEQYLAAATDLVLSVLSKSDQRLRFNDWSPHHGDPGFGRSRLMRLQLHAAPLSTLAPVLGPRQLTMVVSELVRRWDAAAKFGLIAALPRLADLGLLPAAARLFAQLDDIAVMATGTLLAAGHQTGGLRAANFLDRLGGLDPEARTMCLLALLPDLPPDLRCAEIEGLLRDVDDLGRPSSFRADVLRALGPVILGLPEGLRDGLLRRAREPGALTRSESEASELLDSLVDVWPADMLRRRLDEARQIGLRASDIAAAHRVVRPRRSRPDPGAARRPVLSAAEAGAVLDIVATQDDGDKAAALVLLATLLEAAALPAARGIADGISAAHLRLEPAILLAALDPEPGGERLAAILRLLGQVTGGLSRLEAAVDRLTSLIEPGHAPALRPVFAELLQDLPTKDLIVLCPLGAMISEPDFYPQLDRALGSLAVWFGVDGTPPAGRGHATAPLTLDLVGAGGRLVGELARRGEWAIVGSLLAALRSAAVEAEADGRDAAETHRIIAAAERQMIDTLPATSSAAGAAGSGAEDAEGAAERLALLADLVRAAPDGPRRLGPLAAALRAARRLPDSELAAELVRDPAITAPAGRAQEPDLPAVLAAAIDLQLARGDLGAAAAALTALVADRAPYQMSAGRLATHAAESIAGRLDAPGYQAPASSALAPASSALAPDSSAPAPDSAATAAAEAAIDAYLDFLAAHPADYALQEAGGALLRRRIGAAAAVGREVPSGWLRRLGAMADADEPGEVLLHQLALEAACDAAGAAARAGHGRAAAELFRAARVRWQRHRELADCTRYLTAAARAAASALRAAGERRAAAGLDDLAAAAESAQSAEAGR